MNDNIYRLLNETRNNEEFSDTEPLSQEEVTQIMKRFHNDNNVDRSKKITHKKHRFTAVIAAVAAAAVLIPTSVYAYNHISARIEQTAKYRNTVKIETPDDAEPLSENEATYMMYEIGYVPDGFVWDVPPYGGKYHNSETDGGITPVFYRIPADGEDFEIDLRNSESCENYETGDKVAMINYRIGYSERTEDSGRIFGREVWISFNDTRYLLQLFVTNDISRDELYKIIDSVSLYPTDEKMFGEYFGWLDENTEQGAYTDDGSDAVVPENINIVKIGEIADYPDKHGYGSLNFSFTVNSAELTDSFDGINTDGCGDETDFSNYTDENGNILPNTRTWYTVGDGINTLHEDIMSYDMPYHILKLNVTVTNNNDEFKEVCICPNLVNFNSNGAPLYYETDSNAPSGYEDKKINFCDSLESIANSVTHGGRIAVNEFFSFNTDDEHMGEKNYVNLAAGESADFEVCFVCSDNRLEDLYLSFYTIGNGLSETLRDGYPLVDLSDIKPE